MGEKSDLQDQAEELGIEFTESDTIAVLKEKIDEATGGSSEEDATPEADDGVERFPIEYLEANSQALFGVPRSIFVGAKSAGLISGDRLTKDEVAEAVQEFKNYRGGS